MSGVSFTFFVKTLNFTVDEVETGNNGGPAVLSVAENEIPCPKERELYCRGSIDAWSPNDACSGEVITREQTECKEKPSDIMWASITVWRVAVSGENAQALANSLESLEELINKELDGYENWDEEEAPDFEEIVREALERAAELAAWRAGVKNPRVSVEEACTYTVASYTCHS